MELQMIEIEDYTWKEGFDHVTLYQIGPIWAVGLHVNWERDVFHYFTAEELARAYVASLD